jgi:hypothetical protein
MTRPLTLYRRSSVLIPLIRLLVLCAVASMPMAAQARPAREVFPVLDFPEAGIDDSAAYEGYSTRFYRDAKGNTVQIYLDTRSGRVVNLWADDANESVGFTARSSGHPAPLRWASASATVVDSGESRSLTYRLTSDVTRLELGWFVLGSMRVERDVQYAQIHLLPFGAVAFREPVLDSLVVALERLPDAERARHLELLRARDVAELRARVEPVMTLVPSDSLLTVHVAQPSLDVKHWMALDLRLDPREASAEITGSTVSIVSRTLGPISVEVRVSTNAAPLTPLARGEIFDPAFLTFADSNRAVDPRLERQIRAVELLSTREKLMAGLPNFATYFGRDQMMSALMMMPIWTPAMAEHVIGSVLRKLSPGGEVSHEEALGGQAIRESAAEYAALLARYRALTQAGARGRTDSVLAQARDVLEHLDRVRENYAMIDDEFQLPVLVSRYLRDPRLGAAQKRAFLLGTEQGTTRLELLLRELELVVRRALPYTLSPVATNLVGFARRDATHWHSGSWRDSGAGYANGRFAMDINAIWVPMALQSIDELLAVLRDMGMVSGDPAAGGGMGPFLRNYVRDPAALRRARDSWRGAIRHFDVRIAPRQLGERLTAKLASLPAEERRFWDQVLTSTRADTDSLAFLALSLDGFGRPIGVANSDPATRLFLAEQPARGTIDARTRSEVLRDVAVFMRPYPVGLFVAGLGPVVANDAYASPEVWEAFRQDLYHSPRVVWGREVNLFVLGLSKHLAAAVDDAGRPRDPSLAPYVRTLAGALRRTQTAVDASGLRHNELWSYRIVGGHLQPVRYGSSSDAQLWNTTSLAVQFALARLPKGLTQ